MIQLMEILQSLLLGILQGLTEFLPVSSSGHLVIAQWILDSKLGGGLLFEVTLHVATMVAILLFYRKKIIELTVGTFSANPDSLRYIGKLIVGTLPAIGVALLAKNWIEQQFELPETVGLGLLITGGIVWSTRYTVGKGHHLEPTWTGALLIGCAQAIAILPGISRSGSTVGAALALGLSPLAAAQFSFLLGVIAISGAGILLLPELTSISSTLFQTIAFGAVAALLSGLVALWLFVWLLRTQRFYLFAWYAWILGIATLTVALTTT
jgi:undecaprenyl-diphosphatase